MGAGGGAEAQTPGGSAGTVMGRWRHTCLEDSPLCSPAKLRTPQRKTVFQGQNFAESDLQLSR